MCWFVLWVFLGPQKKGYFKKKEGHVKALYNYEMGDKPLFFYLTL